MFNLPLLAYKIEKYSIANVLLPNLKYYNANVFRITEISYILKISLSKYVFAKLHM